jgi:hypothetical protein
MFVLPATATKLHLTRPLHHASRGPPPPLSRGRISNRVLAMRLCIRVLLQATLKNFLPKEGRRSADRRIVLEPHHTSECCHSFVLRARQRPQRRPLAFRRSTAALASGFRLTGSTPGHASWNADRAGVTRPRLSQSRECTSRTGSTGVNDARSRPGAGVNPPAGTALAPSSGIPPEGVP